jgi:hypothetical protein
MNSMRCSFGGGLESKEEGWLGLLMFSAHLDAALGWNYATWEAPSGPEGTWSHPQVPA